MDKIFNGYASKIYATSLAGSEEVVTLRRSGGYLIARNINDQIRDLSGPYPLLCCSNWRGLKEDISTFVGSYVSVTLVSDPFCELGRTGLLSCFDTVRQLNNHYVIEFEKIGGTYPSSHHRRKLKQNRSSSVRIELSAASSDFLKAWEELYGTLIKRKKITDMRIFSKEIFRQQLQVPGTLIFSAWEGSRLLGADWYYQNDELVYAHLSAYSDAGYNRSISYPLLQGAIEYFRSRARCLTLGGIPKGDQAGGLSFFKSGWATELLPTYVCGSVLMDAEFRSLNGGVPPLADGFFPHYRRNDFE